jgi:hypothetical protein
MKDTSDRPGCVLTFHAEDGSTEDLHVSHDVYEHLVRAWHAYQLQRGEPVCFHEFFEHAIKVFLAGRGASRVN